MESLGRRHVASSVGANVFIGSLIVLSLDVALAADLLSRFSESIAVEVFGFDGRDISGIARDLAGGFGLFESSEFFVDLGRDMAE